MIRHQGEYLVVEQDAAPPEEVARLPEKELISANGSFEDRLVVIRHQIAQLKAEKQAKTRHSQKNQSIFGDLPSVDLVRKNPVQIQLHTPSELYSLTQRVHDIESKMGRAELYNQTVHRKGNLVDRAKILQDKLQKLQKMPTESIIANISGYNALVQNKDDHFKYLFLYQQLLKTQGLKGQYQTVKEYLQNLKFIHEQSSLLGPSLMKLQVIHQDILAKAQTSESLYKQVHSQLQTDYKTLNAQLQQLQK